MCVWFRFHIDAKHVNRYQYKCLWWQKELMKGGNRKEWVKNDDGHT